MMITDAEATDLLKALHDEETNLTQAVHRQRLANTEYDLASSRFAAIRDLVKRRFSGESPYSDRMRQRFETNTPLRMDDYRFLGMNPADAAMEVVQESSYPLPLEEIFDRLVKGGLRGPNLLRSVNAGLMNRTGIKKDAEGAYYYAPEEEDIPFE